MLRVITWSPCPEYRIRSLDADVAVAGKNVLHAGAPDTREHLHIVNFRHARGEFERTENPAALLVDRRNAGDRGRYPPSDGRWILLARYPVLRDADEQNSLVRAEAVRKPRQSRHHLTGSGVAVDAQDLAFAAVEQIESVIDEAR